MTKEPVRRLTLRDIVGMTERGEKWCVLTCYDALTAEIFDDAGIPMLLVGDSAAMVVYGYDSTLPVTMEEMLPLVQAVKRGSRRAFIVADMPFGSYQASPTQGLENAVRFMKEGGAHAVKLEGGIAVVPHVTALVKAGIPVIGHVGLTPQSVNLLGGYRVQGRGQEEEERVLADALALEAAGASAVVVEVVPAALGTLISDVLTVPTIGIGAGSGTDAQILVWQDLIGLTTDTPRFVRQYADMRTVMKEAVKQWSDDVGNSIYPSEEHQYR